MSKLESFLRHHKVLTRFRKNLKGEPATEENYTFQELERLGRVSDAILKAFHWASSPEGHDFWKVLFRKAFVWNPLENVMEKDNV